MKPEASNKVENIDEIINSIQHDIDLGIYDYWPHIRLRLSRLIDKLLLEKYVINYSLPKSDKEFLKFYEYIKTYDNENKH